MRRFTVADDDTAGWTCTATASHECRNATCSVSGTQNETRSASRPGCLGWLLIAAILLATVAVLEWGADAFGARYPRIPTPGAADAGDRGLWAYDGTKGWFPRPNAEGRVFLGGPEEGLVHLNSMGLRGREVAARKPDGVRRILVLGDSFVFGVGVNESSAFSSRLEALLNAGQPNRYEVVSMGVSGYSTDQEYLLYQELGASLQPDIVILVACDNDFDGNVQDFAYLAYYKPFFELVEGRLVRHNVPAPQLSRYQSAKLWLGRHSNLWNIARASRFESVSGFFQVARAQSSNQDPQQLMRALLGALRADVERSGARFVLFNTGHRGERTPLFQALRVDLRKDGVTFLGLEGTLGEAREREPGRRWDFGRDTHWNVPAHDLAAQVAKNYLEKIGALRN
jgi:GDSL-like Lipase/Acylhydrolase family